jgi:hypothetical protein
MRGFLILCKKNDNEEHRSLGAAHQTRGIQPIQLCPRALLEHQDKHDTLEL